jgi:hypothetical protein
MSSLAATPERLVCRKQQVRHGTHPENSGISRSGRSRNYKLHNGNVSFWSNCPVRYGIWVRIPDFLAVCSAFLVAALQSPIRTAGPDLCPLWLLSVQT